MHRDRTSFLLLVIFALATALSTRYAWAASVSDWNKRAGTVFYAKSLTDGTHVTLDAVVVEKIRAKQPAKYLTIRECFSPTDKLVIMSPPSSRLRLGQTIDVEGIVWTLANGQRAITSATVTGYCDKTGKLLVHGGPLIKGLMTPTPWPYKVDLTVQSDSQSPVTSTSPEPNTTPPTRPTHYNTIHDATHQVRIQSYGDFVSMADFVCHPVASASSGGYFMMGEDGSQDTLKVYYTGTVSTSQRICRVVGQLREDTGAVQVLCVDSGPGYDPQDGEGGLSLAAAGTVAWAKTLPDGTSVTLGTTGTGKIVTRAFPPDYFYIEDDDQSCGIRVEKTNHGRVAGDRAYVQGTIRTNSNHERYVDATTTSLAGSGTLKPLGMNNKWIGGGDFFYSAGPPINGQQGITGAYGLNNIGLLVRTWGKVTVKDTATPPAWFRIDDGSGVGIKVDLQPSPGTYIPLDSSIVVGSQLQLSGISSCEVSGSDLVRVLRPGPIGPLTFTPPADEYCSCLPVTIRGTKTAGLAIRYTVDGSEPSETNANSRVYDPAGVVIIDPTQTLKARAFEDGWTSTSTYSATYTEHCEPGWGGGYTCRTSGTMSPPSIAGLQVAGVHLPKSMTISWSNVDGNFEIKRKLATDATAWAQVPQLAQTSQNSHVDQFDFVFGTAYKYAVRMLSGSDTSHSELPICTHESGDPNCHPYTQRSWIASDNWQEITVTPAQVVASDNQAVDSRTDTRYVEDVPVDFQFGNGIYRGGLFVGFANDPSRVGRSFLKFHLLPPEGTDRLWAGCVNAYYTRSVAESTTTRVGCQFVENDSWNTQSIKWTNSPPLVPSHAVEYTDIGGQGGVQPGGWCHWTVGAIGSEMYGDHFLSVGLASVSEDQNNPDIGWAYFAKKEFDANLAPQILYAYGDALCFATDLALSSPTVRGGNTVTGTVRLNALAPAGGVSISLSSGICSVYVPYSIVVPEGATSASFTVSTAIVGADVDTVIVAASGLFSARANLKVTQN